MDSNFKDSFGDTEIFNDIKNSIEKELWNMKKVIDSISRLRVEAVYLESDLVMTIDSATWLQISELIGLGNLSLDVGLTEIMKEPSQK